MKRLPDFLFVLLMTLIFIAAEAQTNYKTTADANIRTGPGTRYKSLGIIGSGEGVYVYDTSNSAWFKIEYQGKLGYLSSKLLVVISREEVAPFKKTKVEEDDNTSFWIIGTCIVILIIVYSNRKRNKSAVQPGSTYSKAQTQTVVKQRPPSSYDLHRTQEKKLFVGNKQESKNDPSIVDVNELGYNVQIIVDESSYNDGDYWGLGTKYKEKLRLSDEEVDILNRQWAPTNNFCSISFCCDEVVKLFISALRSINEKFKKEKSTLAEQINIVVDTVLRKHFRYQLNSFNYKSSIEPTSSEIYSTLFKHCENTVRSRYCHKRKLNTDTYFDSTLIAKTEFEQRIVLPLNDILPTLITSITPPDEATEIELNTQNTSRWKEKFDIIAEQYKHDPPVFLDQVVRLAALNKNNPSIENIFFEASRFMAKIDKQVALTFYIHYLYRDLKSSTFDNRQLTKTIQKSIFKTNDQLKAFEVIISNLIMDKDLDKALKGIPGIFSVKRKKINLDSESIKEVQFQHKETVELLNEYLKDEYEDGNNYIKTQENISGELIIQITPKSEVEQKSAYLSTLPFTSVQVEVLDVFNKSSFSVLMQELEDFVKPKGFFMNQVVESINEACYELLDDLLIEEEDEYLTINPDYYQRIISK